MVLFDVSRVLGSGRRRDFNLEAKPKEKLFHLLGWQGKLDELEFDSFSFRFSQRTLFCCSRAKLRMNF